MPTTKHELLDWLMDVPEDAEIGTDGEGSALLAILGTNVHLLEIGHIPNAEELYAEAINQAILERLRRIDAAGGETETGRNDSDISRLHIRHAEPVLYRLQYGVYIQEYRTGGKLYQRVHRRTPQSADSRLPVIRPANILQRILWSVLPVDAPLIRTINLLSPKSKNYGTLATASKTSCREASANPTQLRSLSRRDGQTTWCSRPDPLYEYFQVRTRQKRTAARHPARLCPPHRNSCRTNH